MKTVHSLLSMLLLGGALAVTPVLAETASTAKPAVATQSQAPVAATVNINTADAATLADRLNGVGMKKAEAIVSYREQHGPFKSVDSLLDVTGIGEATLEKNRAMLSVN